MDSTLLASLSTCSPSWMLLLLGMVSIKVVLWKRNTLERDKYRDVMIQHLDSGNKKGKCLEMSFHASRRPYKRQMSSLGRFSLQSQTPENPSVMTFFLLLNHDEGQDISLEELNHLLQKLMLDRYERFNARICPLRNGSRFEV